MTRKYLKSKYIFIKNNINYHKIMMTDYSGGLIQKEPTVRGSENSSISQDPSTNTENK
jgi:hypothetical protein